MEKRRYKRRIFFGLLFSVVLFFSCNTSEKEQEKKASSEKTDTVNTQTGWEEVMSSIVTINSYDGDRILESGQGFYIAEDLVVTKYSLVNRANNILFSPLDTDERFHVNKYVAVDRINDLILLKVDSLKRKPIELFPGTAPNTAKTSYVSVTPGGTIQLFTGSLLNQTTVKGTKQYRITNRIRKTNTGAPVFVSNKKAIGVAFSDVVSFEMQSFAIPSEYIARLLNNHDSEAKSLESLRSFSSEKVAAENRNIKGLLLETETGDFTIRLFNETPEYRDNFIRLVKELYFDSLLIHRVISDFGIQTGAADTRYAEKDDIVGFKGPGYTLPAHVVPGLYHKRGMIGSPRKPDTKNRRLRSDGSQFYIVSGRRYSDKELDEIEKENNYTFSPEQRQTYKTIGGAPHLDGSYTLFGEVISGMDVVDSIATVETDREWRPVTDIRLKKVTILK